nr:hypothetical protein GCM10025732_50230 [Glycomyces mayteni]
MTRSIRVSAPPPPIRGHLPFGGGDIEVTSRWIERGGRPWMPRTGEIHYSRLPRERWDETLGHARAGGLDSVAMYVFWAAHEPEPGRFDWTGNLDLRAFVELAARHGLDVVIRLGPWAHGEYRNGGFPDWLLERDLKARTDDPAYLALVRALYAETIGRLRGLTHAAGGPVIAAQVDNELYDQPGHLATLRAMAEELGLRVPIWTATGWGGAQVPDTLLPVFGAYADGFWEEATTEWPAFAPVHFRYSTTRDDLTVGADLREALDGVAAGPAADRDDVPFATCELGGGMHVAYHRRPLVEPEDVAAVALAKLGSGSAWQGYYMYAGGTQRTGPQGTQQESQATGYPNDVPSLTYDFGAPIGEHGQIRPHHHLLRRQHLWLDADGHRLARMAPHIGDDPGGLRWSVRSDGTSGYLFATTYQPRHHRLPAQPGVQFTVQLPDAAITVPTAPIDLPAGRSSSGPCATPSPTPSNSKAPQSNCSPESPSPKAGATSSSSRRPTACRSNSSSATARRRTCPDLPGRTASSTSTACASWYWTTRARTASTACMSPGAPAWSSPTPRSTPTATTSWSTPTGSEWTSRSSPGPPPPPHPPRIPLARIRTQRPRRRFGAAPRRPAPRPRARGRSTVRRAHGAPQRSRGLLRCGRRPRRAARADRRSDPAARRMDRRYGARLLGRPTHQRPLLARPPLGHRRHLPSLRPARTPSPGPQCRGLGRSGAASKGGRDSRRICDSHPGQRDPTHH